MWRQGSQAYDHGNPLPRQQYLFAPGCLSGDFIATVICLRTSTYKEDQCPSHQEQDALAALMPLRVLESRPHSNKTGFHLPVV